MTTGKQALQSFYAKEGLPEHGNVTVWVDWGRMFGMPVPIPNIFGRTKVLPYHDMHHLVTGYATDEAGEGEVAAWCMAAGGGPLLAWVYDPFAAGLGFIRFPKRVIAAWKQGRKARTLYHVPIEQLLDMEVEEIKVLAHMQSKTEPARRTV